MILRLLMLVFVPLLLLSGLSCGQKSFVDCEEELDIGDPDRTVCVAKTDDEVAMLALNNGNLTKAQTLLEKLIEENPTDWFRYPRLAAVYARQGGFDLINIIDIKGGGGGFLGVVGEFLPTPNPDDITSYVALVEKVGLAKDTLLLMPSTERIPGDTLYGASAEIQLTLYQTAYSIMFMNQFALPSSDGSGDLDPERLEEMTPEDAAVILDNLAQASRNSEQSDPETAAKIDAALEEIDAFPGADNKEKIVNYLNASEE